MIMTETAKPESIAADRTSEHEIGNVSVVGICSTSGR